jgi:hypothetical protein
MPSPPSPRFEPHRGGEGEKKSYDLARCVAIATSIERNKNHFSDTHYNTKLLTTQPEGLADFQVSACFLLLCCCGFFGGVIALGSARGQSVLQRTLTAKQA